jgi:hypothetical protein
MVMLNAPSRWGLVISLSLFCAGCSTSRVSDVSRDARYAGVVGRPDVLDGREYYLYYSKKLNAYSVDSIDDQREEIIKIATLVNGTMVRIERIMREEDKNGESSSFEDFPVISVNNPVTGKMVQARTSFLFLRDSSTLYRSGIMKQD